MHIFSTGLIKAIYLSLAHSLWQGILLALIAALIMGLGRRATPARRYNWLLATFLLFTISGIYTFIYQLQHIAHYQVSIRVEQGGETGFSGLLQQYINQLSSLSYVRQMLALLNRNADMIVMAWMALIGLRMVQHGLGIKYMRQLRRNTATAIDPRWLQFVRETAERMGIKRMVKLAATGMTKVPLTLGYLKPIILVPSGLLLQLSAADLEAVLAHELAHIRRRDYLVNLLQHIVETIYCFNPAVWWVSSLIRNEREHCCDDMAIAHTGDKRNYLNALVNCQEYYLSVPAYALSFAGRRQQLTERVRRLIYGTIRGTYRMEKMLLSIAVLVTMTVSLVLYHYTGRPAMYRTVSKVPAVARPSAPITPASPAVPANPANPQEPVCAPEPVLPAVAATQDSPVALAKAQPRQDTDPVSALIVEMELDGLVTVNTPNLSVELSNTSLEVNGIAQDAAVSQKYRDRYRALSGAEGQWKVNYDRQTN